MAPGMDAITAATDAYVPAGVKKMVADNKQFQEAMGHAAAITGNGELVDRTPPFSKKCKTKFLALKEASKEESIPKAILQCAYKRVKNNEHHDSGKWSYSSHDDWMRTYSKGQK